MVKKLREFDLHYTAQSNLYTKRVQLCVITPGRSTAVQVVSLTACITSVADDIAKKKHFKILPRKTVPIIKCLLYKLQALAPHYWHSILCIISSNDIMAHNTFSMYDYCQNKRYEYIPIFKIPG
jgi:hypothetical protein